MSESQALLFQSLSFHRAAGLTGGCVAEEPNGNIVWEELGDIWSDIPCSEEPVFEEPYANVVFEELGYIWSDFRGALC